MSFIEDQLDEINVLSNIWSFNDRHGSIQNSYINGQPNMYIDISLFNEIFPSKMNLPSLDEESEDFFCCKSNVEENKYEKEEKKIINETRNTSYKREKNDFEKKVMYEKKNSADKKEIKESGENKPFISIPQHNLTSNNNLNFKSEPRNFRVDEAKKHFKVALSEYMTEEINKLIKDSDLPKKWKIHKPNHNSFTSNVKERDNYQFLSYDLKSVFTHGKTDENRQGCNDEIFSKISNYKKCPEKIKIIENFLSLRYKDIIKLFYQSDNFKKFKENELTIFFSDGIKKEKNISLLEEDGLIKLFEMTGKKRRRDLPFFLKV